MTATKTLPVKYQLSTNTKLKSPLQQIQTSQPIHFFKLPQTMSKTRVSELDLKLQQMREHGVIAYGYHNENFQYPIHVRRSHDGEKLPRTISKTKKTYLSDSTILTPSLHENQTKSKQKDRSNRQTTYDERPTTLTIPPNKTINDINPLFNSTRHSTHRKSSLSSIKSSPILCSNRPHSVAGLSLSPTDDQQRNSLSNSSQSLINQSPPMKSLTQRIYKFFHHPPKS